MYLIDQSFTRLAPAIDFSDVVLEDCANTWCVLGSPPKYLRAVHSPALVNAWHERLVHALTQPTQTEQHKGHRRVQVLGNAIFDVDAQGQVHLWSWTFNERDLPELAQLPDITVVAVGVPYKDLWMEGYRAGALRSLVAHFPAQVRQCRNYVAWVSQALLALCWTEEVQEQVRSQIASTLALDPQLLEIASQIQLSTRQRTLVRLEHYNHVVAHKRDYLQLQHESPQFIPLYALLSDELRIGMQVTVSMKYSLRVRALGDVVWRLLSRVGTQWINDYLPYFDQERQTLADCAMEIVQMAVAFGTQDLPPPEVLHALIQLGGNPNGPAAHFVNRVDDQFALCERLGALMARADAKTLEEIKEQAMAIFGWGSDHADAIPEAVMRRLTLKGILKKVQAQAQLDQKRRESGPAWTTPYQFKLEDPNLSAVILDSVLAIWQEGQLMRHCADNFVSLCANKKLVMVSLRDERQRHPLATVAFRMDGDRVQVHKFSGFANRLISDETYALIQECRRQLQRQWQPSLHQETLEGKLKAA